MILMTPYYDYHYTIIPATTMRLFYFISVCRFTKSSISPLVTIDDINDITMAERVNEVQTCKEFVHSFAGCFMEIKRLHP
jgi:hypothetical protein